MVEEKFSDEKLTEEQLEGVAGGRYAETADDTDFLFKLGLMNARYDFKEIAFSSGTEIEQKVYDAYQKLGIGFVWHGDFAGSNGYYAGQNSLTQKEAWALARENAKKWKLGIYSE